jgi:hypothetical protein
MRRGRNGSQLDSELSRQSAAPCDGRKKVALGVNKADGSLLHSTRVHPHITPFAIVLTTYTRSCIEPGVNIVPVAAASDAPSLGLGCKGGVRDGYGCAHHLTLEEGAHVRA